MKALVVDGEWSPREGSVVSAEERLERKAFSGSRVWRNTRFEMRDMPQPGCKDDELLIKVKSCGICGSDTHLLETDKEGYILFSGLTKLPCVLGHEFAGVVEETGKSVTRFRPGDLVAVESVMWCGMCVYCRSGAPNQCDSVELMGLSSNGALAEYAAVNQRYCWDIGALRQRYQGDELFDIGALVEPVGCAYNGIFIAGGGFLPGSTVVVYGAGPIGLGAIALSRASGAGLVVAFDVNPGRVKIAKEMGADHAFTIAGLNGRRPSEVVMELTKGGGAEVQVEAAGAAPQTVPEMEMALSPQGKIIYLGRAATSTPIHLNLLVTGADKVIGARGHAGYGIFPNIIRLISAGRLDLAPMVTRHFSFNRAIDALKASSDRNEGKILVRF